MVPDRVSNPGPLTYESGALPTALRGPARVAAAHGVNVMIKLKYYKTHLQNTVQ